MTKRKRQTIHQKLDLVIDMLCKMQAHQIAAEENRSLGHPIIYDTKTGRSKSIFGGQVDPSKLDKHGRQVRL